MRCVAAFVQSCYSAVVCKFCLCSSSVFVVFSSRCYIILSLASRAKGILSLPCSPLIVLFMVVSFCYYLLMIDLCLWYCVVCNYGDFCCYCI